MKKKTELPSKKKARSLFVTHHGYLKASEAFANGIHPRDFYALRDQGEIQLVTRGLFRLTAMPKLESPALFTVGVKIPRGIVCLQSALEFHKLVPQQRSEISVALVKGSEKPQIHGLSLKVYLISEPAFSTGIEVHRKDGIDVQIYSPEKTLVDCFKFRNKIGLDICLQALQTWWKSENKNLKQLSEFSKICRMENVIRPYLELLRVQGSFLRL